MNKNYLIVIGERLRAFRHDRKITLADVAQKGGITIEQAESVERGETDSLSAFVSYIHGSDLYMFFGEKSPERETPHDFGDMIDKMSDAADKLRDDFSIE